MAGIAKYFILLEVLDGWRLEVAFDPLASVSEVRATAGSIKRQKAVSVGIGLTLTLAAAAIGLVGLVSGASTTRLQAIGTCVLFLIVFSGLSVMVMAFLRRVKHRYISPQFRQTRILLTIALCAFTLSYLAGAITRLLVYFQAGTFAQFESMREPYSALA